MTKIGLHCKAALAVGGKKEVGEISQCAASVQLFITLRLFAPEFYTHAEYPIVSPNIQYVRNPTRRTIPCCYSILAELSPFGSLYLSVISLSTAIAPSAYCFLASDKLDLPEPG